MWDVLRAVRHCHFTGGYLRRVVWLPPMLVLAFCKPACAYDLSISGNWYCNDHGKLSPLVGARVEVWRSVAGWTKDFDIGGMS